MALCHFPTLKMIVTVHWLTCGTDTAPPLAWCRTAELWSPARRPLARTHLTLRWSSVVLHQASGGRRVRVHGPVCGVKGQMSCTAGKEMTTCLYGCDRGGGATGAFAETVTSLHRDPRVTSRYLDAAQTCSRIWPASHFPSKQGETCACQRSRSPKTHSETCFKVEKHMVLL